MHYAVPRILQSAGMLNALFTDLCTTKGFGRIASSLPGFLQKGGIARLAGRTPVGVPAEKTTSFDLFGLSYERRRRKAASQAELMEAFLWSGRRFCELVQENLSDDIEGIYTFNSAGLELLEAVKGRGVPGIVEQTIAPKKVEVSLLATERERFPGWETESVAADAKASHLIDRELAEWHAASSVICASDFVKDGIIASGGPPNRCVVVPYGADPFVPTAEVAKSQRTERRRKLRVLTVGAVELRKGSPYVLEVAKRLSSDAEFRMVGSVDIAPEKAAILCEHVELTGRVSRISIREHFEWADVFFLPSVCEGSATVTYEAFNSGLPVVCTPNTGSMVEDGSSGYLVPHGDIEQMVSRIGILAADRDLLAQMQTGAITRAEACTVAAYGERLVQTIQSCFVSETAS